MSLCAIYLYIIGQESSGKGSWGLTPFFRGSRFLEHGLWSGEGLTEASWQERPAWALIRVESENSWTSVKQASNPNSAAATAAKSLQLCPTLCDLIDGSPPGSPVPGILQARTLEWVAISFSNACMHAKLLQSCPTLCDPMLKHMITII